MSLQQILTFQGNLPPVPKKLLLDYPNIAINPEIHSGLPHIKGTRILAFDIFRSQVKGHSINSMILDFKTMGVIVSEKQLEEAVRFTLDWLHDIIHGQKTSKASK